MEWEPLEVNHKTVGLLKHHSNKNKEGAPGLIRVESQGNNQELTHRKSLPKEIRLQLMETIVGQGLRVKN